jgi:hypothetical protein
MRTLDRVTIALAGTTIGLVGGWTAARRQHGGLSSERLLDVAEAYVIILREALQCVLYPHDGEPRFAECRRLQGELWVLISRIELLYGRESRVARHAIEATGALAAVEVLVGRDTHTEGDPSLRNCIDAEEASVEREYRAFLDATRAAIRAGRRALRARASELACARSRHRHRPPTDNEATGRGLSNRHSTTSSETSTSFSKTSNSRS